MVAANLRQGATYRARLSRSRALRALLSLPAKVLLALIGLYRVAVSPLLPRRCRYYPTCSQYAFEAVSRYGAIRGSWLAVRRILRCHPLAPGGYDPVP